MSFSFEIDPDPPTEVEFDSIEQTSVRVSWTAPVVKNGPIAFYRIVLTSSGNPERSEDSKYCGCDLFFLTTYIVYVQFCYTYLQLLLVKF